MERVQTKYGEIHGIKQYELYPNGTLKTCTVEKEFKIDTEFGQITPKYDDSQNRRKNKSSLEFFDSGNIKKVYMQQQESIKTDYGIFPAEMIMFYDNGNIKKIFPLNGKITGFWTEQHEYDLSTEIAVETKSLSIKKKLMSIGFYEDGSFKHITMWPRERILAATKYGDIEVRNGVAFYEDGSIKSLEPAKAVKIDTVIGVLTAFDTEANGMNADVNSLNFYEDGNVKSLKSSSDRVKVYLDGKLIADIEPEKRVSMCNDSVMVPIPMEIEFKGGSVVFNSSMKFNINKYDFVVSDLKDEIKVMKTCGM